MEADWPPTKLTAVEDWVPVTSPDKEPEKLAAVPAVVADVAFPLKLAVMVPAEKLPEASLRTTVEAELALVAELASETPEATLAADCPPTEETTVADWVPVTFPERDPEKLTAKVALLAVPVKLAVTVPAEKLPDASLRTIVEAELEDAASLASLEPAATLEAVSPPTEETTVED